jgi:hypothetical protein
MFDVSESLWLDRRYFTYKICTYLNYSVLPVAQIETLQDN